MQASEGDDLERQVPECDRTQRSITTGEGHTRRGARCAPTRLPESAQSGGYDSMLAMPLTE